jgi:hypothetical protein
MVRMPALKNLFLLLVSFILVFSAVLVHAQDDDDDDDKPANPTAVR